MARERLSLMQKNIISVLIANKKVEKTNLIEYKKLHECTYKLHKHRESPKNKELFEKKSDENFRKIMYNMYKQTLSFDSSFSRSLRNLVRKGYVRLYTQRIWDPKTETWRKHRNRRVVGAIILIKNPFDRHEVP